MQIEKIKVVIASTLKPVDDTRMFEKIGISLADCDKYEVFIIGFHARRPITYPFINFIPLQPFKRISWSRLLAAWRILAIVRTIKPSVFIFCTHELLLPAVFYKLFSRKKIIYDIHENYFRNVFFLPTFPLFLRPWLACYIRVKEYCVAPFVDHFILAERGYEQELHFPGNKKTTLENKIRKPVQSIDVNRDANTIRLLFSGTLAKTTGVFEAIGLAKALHSSDPRVRLTIIGYCALDQTLDAIKSLTENCSFIEIIGGDHLVPHHQILKAIEGATAGVISYPPNPATQNSIPTKLFEYLGYSLPIILIDHAPWVVYCLPYNACITVDFNAIDTHLILEQLRTKKFYLTVPEDVFWLSEESKLLSLMEQLTVG